MALSTEQRPWRLMFRAFRYRNYRLFFGGQGISLIGTWMQRIAIGWLVYRLTQSPAMLGLAGFFSQFPTFVLAPFAGVMADKFDRHKIMVIAQVLAMLQAVVLAALIFTNTITVWWVVALTAVLALVNAFDIPARQSFIVEMVEDKKDLGNAIALNSAMFNSARLIGPSIAGVIIAAVGEGLCFTLNAVSSLAVIAALLAMKLAPRSAARSQQNVFQELKMGFNYAFGSVPIRSTLILLAIVSLV
ncbi:MAG TPA: MFS transporter, partial [bacterium]